MSTLGWRDISVYGEAIASHGLAVRQGVSGVGLVTRGFLYGKYDIYIDTQTALTTTWADSNASITTSWTDSDTLANNANATHAVGSLAFFRTSVANGGATFLIGTRLVATNGQLFETLYTDQSFGSSGLNSWAGFSFGVTIAAGAVYRDPSGNTWTVTQDFGGIGQLHTIGPTLTSSVFNTANTLTKVSGTGDATIVNAIPQGEDFYFSSNVQSVLVGTQANVADNSITTFVVPVDSNLQLVSSQVSGGDGTGWMDDNFGNYSEALND